MKNTHNFILISMFLLFFVTGCDESLELIEPNEKEPIETRAATVTHENFYYIEEDTIFSPCTLEEVSIYAVHHLVLHSVISGNGSVHVSIHDNAPQVEMIGLTTGWEYQVNFNQSQVLHFETEQDLLPYNESFHFTSLSHVPGIGQTLGFKVHYKLTVTPNGNIATEFFRFEIVCP